MDPDGTTLLLACLRQTSDALNVELLAHSSAELWRMAAEQAKQHRCAPILYHHINRLGITLPGELAEELRQRSLENASRNIRLFQKLGGVLQRLSEKNLPAIVLKGGFLAAVIYDNIGLRTMGDIDLLVKIDDVVRVDEELLALGYQRLEANPVITRDNHNFSYTLREDGSYIEIHWALFDSNLPLQIDTDGLWSRAQPFTLAQVPALALSPEDLLLHLCLHAAEGLYYIRMLCDIDEVIQHYGAGIDWQEVVTRSRHLGISRPVYVILRLTQDLLSAAVPQEHLAALQPACFDERYLVAAREQILAPGVLGDMVRHRQAARLWGPEALGVKLSIIGQNLLPSRARMAGMYRAQADSWRIFLYYPVHVKDLLVQHGGILWRMARRDPNMRASAARTNQARALRDWLMS